MDNRLYFFDFVEHCLADAAYQNCMALSCEGIPFDMSDNDLEKFVHRVVFGNVQGQVYDYIKNNDNIQIHKFFSFSLLQVETYNPLKREGYIQEKLNANLWGIEESNDPLDSKNLYIINRYIKAYETKFFYFEVLLSSLHDDFKSGLLVKSNSFQPMQDPPKTSIKYESFQIFIKQLEYNYPFNIAPLSFKYTMRDNLDYLKKEILNNLVIIDKDARKPYLNQIRYQIYNLTQNTGVDLLEIAKLLKKYNIPTVDDIRLNNFNNELYNILNREPPDIQEEYEDGFNQDTYKVQTEFYSYYYMFYIQEALKLIDEQLNELNPSPSGIQEMQTAIPPTSPKLNTNLTVPQLSYLFKMLMDIHPPIFVNKTNKEIYQFIEASFTTKGKEETGPTVAKLNNLNSNVDKATAEFWAIHLKKMLEDSRHL